MSKWVARLRAGLIIVTVGLMPALAANHDLDDRISAIYPRLGDDPQAAWIELESLQAAVEQADVAVQVRWYLAAAHTQRALGHLSRAKSLADRGLELSRHSQDQEGVLDAMLLHGQILAARGRFGEALDEFNALIDVSAEHQNLRFAATAYAGIGEAHTVRGDYPQAIAALLKAYELYREMDAAEGMRSTSLLLGNLYAEIDLAEQALAMYADAAALDRQKQDNLNLAVSLYNIGRAYADMGNIVAAREHHRQALSIARRLDSRVHEAHVLFGLGLSYTVEDAWQQAVPLLQQAAEIAEQISDSYLLARIRVQLARAATVADRHADSMSLLELAHATMAAAEAKRDLAQIHANMAENLAAMGHHQQAYQHVLEHSRLTKDMASEERARRTAALRVRFDSARVESEKEALSRENNLKAQLLDRERRFSRYTAAGLLLLMLIAGALAFSFRRQKGLQRRLTELANTDALTGLMNRRRSADVGQKEIRRARRYGKPLAILAIDIDFFKNINDRYGHPVGDRVLVALTRQWSVLLRDTDYLGRFGGEEFIAILPETDVRQAMEVAQRICRGTAQLDLDHCGVADHLTASIGVAHLQHGEDRFHDLFKRADHALYAAKEAGRNRVVKA